MNDQIKEKIIDLCDCLRGCKVEKVDEIIKIIKEEMRYEILNLYRHCKFCKEKVIAKGMCKRCHAREWHREKNKNKVDRRKLSFKLRNIR
jgi:phosphopentomutase